MRNTEDIRTKSEKREKIKKKLNKKWVKHNYWDLWRELLKKQEESVSRALKKILHDKIKVK